MGEEAYGSPGAAGSWGIVFHGEETFVISLVAAITCQQLPLHTGGGRYQHKIYGGIVFHMAETFLTPLIAVAHDSSVCYVQPLCGCHMRGNCNIYIPHQYLTPPYGIVGITCWHFAKMFSTGKARVIGLPNA